MAVADGDGGGDASLAGDMASSLPSQARGRQEQLRSAPGGSFAALDTRKGATARADVGRGPWPLAPGLSASTSACHVRGWPVPAISAARSVEQKSRDFLGISVALTLPPFALLPTMAPSESIRF